MKRKLFYKTAYFFFLFALLPCGVMAQETVQKQIEESHDFSENSTLVLDNKYGDVHIKGWDRNTISITVEISSTDDNTKDAQELLDRIQPSIKVVGDQIIITSEIAKKEIGFIEKFFNKSSGGKRSKSQINFTLSIPNRAKVELTNKYGDVVVSGWNGSLEAQVEHGDIRLPDALDTSLLSIKYGKLKASSLGESKVILGDARADIKEATQLEVESKGSELILGSLGRLLLNSNKDEIEIDKANHVSGKIKYTNTLINDSSQNVDLELELAELRIMKFSSAHPSVQIMQENSEVYMNISNTSFQFQANLEQGVLRIPKTMENISSDILDKKKKIRNITASYGTNRNSVFSFTGKKGVIILKEL